MTINVKIKLKWLLPVVSTVLLAAACRTPVAAVGDPAVMPEAKQVWQLVEMRGKAVGSTAIVLTVNPEASTLSGRTACNRYAADCVIRFDNDQPAGTRYTLTVSNLESGSVSCPEADMNAEERYLALLKKADSMLIDAYTLTLCQRGKPILKYELR